MGVIRTSGYRPFEPAALRCVLSTGCNQSLPAETGYKVIETPGIGSILRQLT